jgi:hypothetical protein
MPLPEIQDLMTVDIGDVGALGRCNARREGLEQAVGMAAAIHQHI